MYMKKQRVVVLTEQDLGAIIKQLLNTIGLSTDSSFEEKTGKIPDYKGSTNFKDVTYKIIDTLEGGYYHPDMLKDGRVKDGRYGKSGETMFGMDRKAGNTEATAPGREFWRLIDNENARKNWKWNYMLKDNPSLANKLKDLIVQIMEPNFNSYMEKYLTPEAQKLVKSNPKLYFNFVYATWNGPGWFKKFAKDFNQKVKDGFLSQEDLVKSVVDKRKNDPNSLASGGGKKIEKIFSSMV